MKFMAVAGTSSGVSASRALTCVIAAPSSDQCRLGVVTTHLGGVQNITRSTNSIPGAFGGGVHPARAALCGISFTLSGGRL